MNAADFRALALAVPNAIESTHMNHPDFRIGGKIFASLGYPDAAWGMVKLTPEQQRSMISADSKAFQPCNGKWGLRGITLVRLASAKKNLVRVALDMASENVPPVKATSQKAAPARKKDPKPGARKKLSKAAITRIRNRIIKAVSALPGAMVVGVPKTDHASLEVRGKRFGWLLVDHHGDGRIAINVKGEPGASQTLTEEHPDRYHIPKYLGHRGWIGLWIDGKTVDWKEVSAILATAYRLI